MVPCKILDVFLVLYLLICASYSISYGSLPPVRLVGNEFAGCPYVKLCNLFIMALYDDSSKCS